MDYAIWLKLGLFAPFPLTMPSWATYGAGEMGNFVQTPDLAEC